MSQNSNNQDTTLKTIGVAALAVIIFALLYNLLLGGSGGFGFNMGHNSGYGFGMGYNSGFGLNALLGSVLGLAVQLLWLVFIVSLVIGGVMLVKKHIVVDEKKFNLNFLNLIDTGYTCPGCGTKLKTEYKFCPNCKTALKEKCTKCGKELQGGWKCCPDCGTEKTMPQK